jgi:hypothetical protein
MHRDDNEFDRLMREEFNTDPQPGYTDPHPYGAPAQPVKAGLTKRGKAALAIGTTVIAGGALIGYQAYSADAAANDAKAQEIALKTQALELEKLKELNRANETVRKTTAAQAESRQALVDKCVKSNKSQVGKGFGSPSYSDIVDACQAQYAATATTDSMQPAGSATTVTDGSSGGVNNGMLIGGGLLVSFLVYAAKKGTRNQA